MIRPPSRLEIELWRARLADPDFQRPVLQFQRSVYELFETLRRETGARPIRGLIYRDQIKSLESVTEKIARKRASQIQESPKASGTKATPYDFDDIRDFVGIKVLCPFATDAEQVAKYLFLQTDRLRVVEDSVAAGRREDSQGYRGYNFTVYPAMGRRFELTSLHCEVQIKTLLEEAWDAMTHDLTYKRQQAIPRLLSKAFSALSKTLAAVQEQGENFREQVEEVFAVVTKHREGAALAFFSEAAGELKALREKHPDLGIQELDETLPPKPGTFTAENIAAINEGLRLEIAATGIGRGVCRVATFVALCSRLPGEVAFAIRLANDLVGKRPESAWVEAFRASVFWALGRFDDSVASAERTLSKTDDAPETTYLPSDFCYFVSDGKIFHAYVPAETERQVLEFADRLAADPKARPEHIDTAGLALIVFGDLDAVRRGRNLVEKAYELAQRGDDRDRRMAEAFCLRHKHLAQMRLDDDAWW